MQQRIFKTTHLQYPTVTVTVTETDQVKLTDSGFGWSSLVGRQL